MEEGQGRAGGDADPGGENSEFTSSGFVWRSSTGRIGAELAGHGFYPRKVLLEQEQGWNRADLLLRAAGDEEKQEQVQVHWIIY